MLRKASLCNSKCRTPKPSSEEWHHQMEAKSDGSPHLLPHQQSDKVETHVFSCSWCHGNVCNLLLNTVPRPFILTSKCMLSTHQTVKTPSWGSWALARVNSHEFNKCSHYQSFSLPSDCPNDSVTLKTKGEWKQGNSQAFDQLGLRNAISASKPTPDHLNVLELTWPSQWVEANFHWWDHDWGGGGILHSCLSWRSALPWCDAVPHAPSGLSSSL